MSSNVLRVSRRGAIASMLAAGLGGLACYSDTGKEVGKPYGWLERSVNGRSVFERGQGDRVVVLLHELNGLSPGCIDFGLELVCSGFRVYMPLLFGHPGQNNVVLGSIESCVFGGFRCFAEGKNQDPKPVVWVSRFVKLICGRPDVRAVGVIGMCETGAYPIATMEKGTKVKAVVLSQPALPLGRARQLDVGIAPATMKKARESGISILAFRFKEDTISSNDRFHFLSNYFGPRQFEGHQLDGPAAFRQTCTHRLHAVLTGLFADKRENARRMTINFLAEKLV
jgi:dienelactone hydrolase